MAFSLTPPLFNLRRTRLRLTGCAVAAAAAWSGFAAAQDPFAAVTAGSIVTERGGWKGCAWGDYDNDGDEDIYVTDRSDSTSALYRNNGDGTFAAVTGSLVTSAQNGEIPLWADINHDGWLDLYVGLGGLFNLRSDLLFLNDGAGGFVAADDAPQVGERGNTTGAAFADYNQDGLLDQVVVNWAEQLNVLYDGVPGPEYFEEASRNDVGRDRGRSNTAIWGDVNDDGFIDLFVANGTGDPIDFFYINDEGSLDNQPGALISANGGDSLGASFADYDNDGDLDLYVTRAESNYLYRNDGPGGGLNSVNFSLVLNSALVTETAVTSMCAAWGDYDNDGWLDVYITNGNVTALENMLFRNRGDGSFQKVIGTVAVAENDQSGGCAWADYDNDGFLDLFACGGGNFVERRNELFRNQGNDNGWLKVKCVGTRSNGSAIGAVLRATATIDGREVTQRRDISSGTGLASQNSLIAHFGLGDAEEVGSLEIRWPSGAVQVLEGIAANQLIEVVEPETPFRITSAVRNPDGSLTITFLSIPGESYAVDLATPDDFAADTWTEQGTIQASDSETEFTITGIENEDAAFARVRRLP